MDRQTQNRFLITLNESESNENNLIDFSFKRNPTIEAAAETIINVPETSIIELDHGNSDTYNFLKVYLDFGFYFCYVPFKLVRDSTTNTFRLSTSRIQQTLCIITHFMVIFRFASRLRKVSLEGIGQKSFVYFDLFGNFATLLYQIVFIKLLWTKSKHFLEVVMYIENASNLPRPSKKVYSLAFMICIIYTFIVIAHSLIGHELIHSSNWSISLLSTCYIEEAKYSYFLKPFTKFEKCDKMLAHGTKSLLELDNISSDDIILGLSMFLMCFYRYFAAFFIDLSILMCALTLWVPAKSFANYIKYHPLETLNVYEKYICLKTLSSKISAGIGSLVIIYFLEGILYYSSNMDKIIVVNDYFEKFRVSVYLVTLSSILTICGRTCKVVEESVHHWINFNNNSSKIPQHKLGILLNELNQHAVGISGNGLFTVSFTLVAQMCSVVVTYFIITLDFKSA